jgi:hypothetical protein
MNRRDFLKHTILGITGIGFAPEVLARMRFPAMKLGNLDDHIKDYLHKMRNFNEPHRNDIKLDSEEFKILESTLKKMRYLQQFIGHGNFSLLGFDEGLRFAKSYSQVERFSRNELRFMEKIFYDDAELYGFFGRKPLKNLTDQIHKKDVIKVPHSGNYLFRGLPIETFKRIRKEAGDDVILTSGIRGMMKQFLLFLNKAYKSNGNLSLASRSLAPPGYSYHSTGDFDVGQVGLGEVNFTKRFTTTGVFRKLSSLGYLTLRYPQNNSLGVRYEPWHVKV